METIMKIRDKEIDVFSDEIDMHYWERYDNVFLNHKIEWTIGFEEYMKIRGNRCINMFFVRLLSAKRFKYCDILILIKPQFKTYSPLYQVSSGYKSMEDIDIFIDYCNPDYLECLCYEDLIKIIRGINQYDECYNNNEIIEYDNKDHLIYHILHWYLYRIFTDEQTISVMASLYYTNVSQ